MYQTKVLVAKVRPAGRIRPVSEVTTPPRSIVQNLYETLYQIL